MRYFIDISYLGTNYHGWQIQKNAITVQKKIEESLSILLGDKIKTIGSGRTDTGVHAFSQIVHFDTLKKRLDYKWLNGINSNLPKDVMVKNIYHVDENFQARYSFLTRT